MYVSGGLFINNFIAQSPKHMTDFHYGLRLKEFFMGKESPTIAPLRGKRFQEQKLVDLKTFGMFIFFTFNCIHYCQFVLCVSQ